MSPAELISKSHDMSSRDLVGYARSDDINNLSADHWYALVLVLSSRLNQLIDRCEMCGPDTVLAASAAYWELPHEEA